MNRIYKAKGEIRINSKLVKKDSRIGFNTRFSIADKTSYVAIIEVQLPSDIFLENDEDHQICVRVLSDILLKTNIEYSVKNPLKHIGTFKILEILN